jgi:hypothetical protein
VSQHLREVEALLDQIRADRSIDDVARAHQISEVLAAANARALSLHSVELPPATPVAPSPADVLAWPRWHRRLAATG